MDNVDEKEKVLRETVTRGILNGIQSMLERVKTIEDPTIKNVMILDKFLTMYDLFSGFVESNIDSYIENKETKALTKKTMKDLYNVFRELQDWVLHPNYSPDKIYGNALMNGSNFERKSNG